MTVPADEARALLRCRRSAPGQRAAPRPRLRATTSRHTRNGRSAACGTTSGPIAAPGQGAAQSPAAASSSTQAGRPAARPIRPVTGSGRALSDNEPAGCARGTGPASDPCPAAGAMTMPCTLTCPNRIRAEPKAGPPPEPRSESQYERHSTAATVPTQHPVRGQQLGADGADADAQLGDDLGRLVLSELTLFGVPAMRMASGDRCAGGRGA
jgi:hypothetical protein